VGFSDKELEALYLAVRSDPHRQYGTPYIEKLLENLASVKFSNEALKAEIANLQEKYFDAKDTAEHAVASTNNAKANAAIEIDHLKRENTQLKQEILMLPQKLRDKYEVFCKDCRYAKKGFFYLVCRRFPAKRMTFSWRTCGECRA